MQVTRNRRLFNLLFLAAYKMSLRAKRPPDAAKWPIDGVDENGDRDWKKCDTEFLFNKLDEEVDELNDACFNPQVGDSIQLEAADVAAVSMMIADKSGAFDDLPVMPNIVCLCGSTKFYEEFMAANFRETMSGNIVLSVGFFMHAEHKAKRMEEALTRISQGVNPLGPAYWEIKKLIDTGSARSYAETVDLIRRVFDGSAQFQETLVQEVAADALTETQHGEAVGITEDQKIGLDALHKRKIDLADEILVLNVGGYIGSSTRSEIEYAVATHKPVRFLEPV